MTRSETFRKGNGMNLAGKNCITTTHFLTDTNTGHSHKGIIL